MKKILLLLLLVCTLLAGCSNKSSTNADSFNQYDNKLMTYTESFYEGAHEVTLPNGNTTTALSYVSYSYDAGQKTLSCTVDNAANVYSASGDDIKYKPDFNVPKVDLSVYTSMPAEGVEVYKDFKTGNEVRITELDDSVIFLWKYDNIDHVWTKMK